MAKNDQPLLSAKFDDPYNPDFSIIRFPVLVSPKIDGFRCRAVPNVGAVSRTFKPFPNRNTQEVFKFSMDRLKYFDGEITHGPITNNPKLCNDTSSAMMTADGAPKFEFHVFDNWFHPEVPFEQRLDMVRDRVQFHQQVLPWLKFVEHKLVHNIEELLAYEAEQLTLGYEGIMIRDPKGLYKNGRSTLKQGILIKLKRFEDREAICTGFEALERNQNPQQADHFGHAKRSSHKAGKVPDDLLGVLLGRDALYGDIRVGSGFDTELRTEIWNNKSKYLGQPFTYWYQPKGTREKPRQPIFKAWRPKGT